MRIRIAIAPAAMLCLLLALPTAAASFSNRTSNDANSFEADILAPATGLGVSCGATITLDWTATVDTYATGHRVFRSTTSGGPYSQIAEVTPRTTVTYDDTPAAGIYYYVVRAYYLNWESSESGEAVASTGTCAPPSVSGLAPSSGPTAGGTSVVISGSGFVGTTAVDFGATPASGFVVDSDTQITATSPAGALGTVDVAVTTPLGTSANTAADDYTYDCTPTWWDSAYGYRAEITVSAGADSVTTGYSVGIAIDHAQLVAGGKSLASGADVRLLRWDDGACSWSELDRVLQEGSSWAIVDTTLWFSVQADIAANTDDAGYFLYYGDSGATGPPADKTNVYAVWDDFDDSTLGSGWSLDAIGSVAGGTVSESGTVVRISATNTGDIWNNSDDLYHLARDVSGDFLAESYTSAAGGTHDGWSKYGGVHLRDSSSANSVNRNMSEIYTSAGSTNSYRLATGGATAEQLGQRYDYNRIILVGDTSRTFNSADGTTWGEIGTSVTFTSSLSDPVRIGPLLAGLSSSSHWVDVDWFKIRLYVDDEPTAAAGTEEPQP